MDYFGGFHRIQAISDFLDGGDEVLRLDQVGVIGDERGIYLLFGIEGDVCPRYALYIVQFLADFGDTSDFAHHAGNGELGDGFFRLTRPIYMDDFDGTLAATSEQRRTEHDSPKAVA